MTDIFAIVANQPAINDHNERKRMRAIVSVIIDAAADVSGIPREYILGKRRDKSFVLVRQACVRVARMLNITYPQIAQVMRRDHTTIMHAAKRSTDMDCVLVARSIVDCLSGREYQKRLIPYAPGGEEKIKRVRVMPPPNERPRVAPFPPGADELIMSGCPTVLVLSKYKNTGWIAP